MPLKLDHAHGLSRLFSEQRAPLNSYFLKRTAHAWDAQDLLQETYLRLLAADQHGADDIRNPEPFRKETYGIPDAADVELLVLHQQY